tara:strand:+ start:3130 stop:3657 length:528 start_codon:yes stop_codon:yes gene_type:complete
MHNNLPKRYYFISNYNKANIIKQSKETAIIYRNYENKINKQEILKIKKICKEKKIKFLISNAPKLAIGFNLDGLYIPSFNSRFEHLNYKYKKDFFILGSAHNIKQIRTKENQKVNLIFISSIFKKNKNFLGLIRFNNLTKLTNKKCIALGGISEKNKNLLRLTNSFGFAGISFFE